MHLSKDGKYIRFEIDVWYQEDDGSIHLTSNDPDVENFHTTVNNKADSKRRHENMFRKLGQLLDQNGKPSPISGAG